MSPRPKKDPFGIEKLAREREAREAEREAKEAAEEAAARRALRGRAILMFISLAVLFTGVIHLAGWGLYGHFVVGPEFKKDVHGHTLNAYYANTPVLMIRELETAKNGMRAFGLDDHEYSTLKPWEQTPDNRMDYQYQLMDSVIERIRAVEEDRLRQERQGTSDQFGDIYEEKMDNLRTFLFEDGWIDETAEGAYQIEHHPYWAWWSNWGLYTVPLFLLVGIGGIVPYAIKKSKEGGDSGGTGGLFDEMPHKLVGMVVGVIVFLIMLAAIVSFFFSSGLPGAP